MSGIESLRVLVADDNENMRRLLKAMLQAIGVTIVREAADGQQALEAARHWRADVIIIDMQMEPVDGIEFTRAVRSGSSGADPYVPIVMLTGIAHRSRVIEARDAGITEFLVKPVSAKALVARLKTLIERDRKFVRAESYVGPDRRRRSPSSYSGPNRRATD